MQHCLCWVQPLLLVVFFVQEIACVHCSCIVFTPRVENDKVMQWKKIGSFPTRIHVLIFFGINPSWVFVIHVIVFFLLLLPGSLVSEKFPATFYANIRHGKKKQNQHGTYVGSSSQRKTAKNINIINLDKLLHRCPQIPWPVGEKDNSHKVLWMRMSHLGQHVDSELKSASAEHTSSHIVAPSNQPLWLHSPHTSTIPLQSLMQPRCHLRSDGRCGLVLLSICRVRVCFKPPMKQHELYFIPCD